MAYNEKLSRADRSEQPEKRRSLPSFNRVTLIGNTGSDIQVHTTKDGRTFATFDVATTESWLDPNTRERQERTDWHKVGVYRKGLVSLAEQYLGKGSRVFIDGQLRNNRWTDAKGSTRTDTEVAVTARKGEMIIFSAKQPTESTQTGQDSARPPHAQSANTSNWDAAGRRVSRTVGEPTPPRTTPNRRKP